MTRKITRAVAAIQAGKQDCLYLGNLDAKRDWGYAPDYVEGMWMMMQASKPDDFVLATGETHAVREFVKDAFQHVGIDIEWRGAPGTVEEVGVDAKTKKTLVAIDPEYFRPTEVELLIGNAAKARETLKWKPRVSYKGLVKIMVEADVAALRGDQSPATRGFAASLLER